MKKGTETKERIADIALELFHSRGYNSTSMNDLVEATGVKKGNLYFHYSSKEELAVKVLKEALLKYENFINRRICGKSFYEKLISLIDAIVEYHLIHGGGRGCIFGNMALETGGDGSSISELVKEVFRGWERDIAGIVSRGIAAGEFQINESPEQMARVITSQLEGGIMLSKIYSDYCYLQESAEFIKNTLKNRLNNGVGHASKKRDKREGDRNRVR